MYYYNSICFIYVYVSEKFTSAEEISSNCPDDGGGGSEHLHSIRKVNIAAVASRDVHVYEWVPVMCICVWL